MVNKVFDALSNLIKKGLFHIIGSTFLNKCIVFITNIALVRILSKENFGIFTAAFNVFSIIFLFSGFGINSGVLYFGVQKNYETKKKNIYNFSLKFGLVCQIILMIAMIIYAFAFKQGISESKKYIYLLSLLPFIAFLFDYITIILRSEKLNKRYSLLMNINTCLYSFMAIIGSLIWGILGTILGRYFAYIISCVIGSYLCKPAMNNNQCEVMSKNDKKDLISYSIKAGLTSSLNNILYRLDVLIIATIIADASILASYKVGTQIPENMNFIPQSIMIFILPIFVEHSNDLTWLKKNVKRLYSIMFCVIGVISITLMVIAPWLITLLWGNDYIDAAPCFRILTISFFFLSTFRLTSTNILLSLGKSGYTLIVSIVSGVINILLDLILTLNYGSIGAAYATLFVTILAAMLSFPYVVWLIYKGG